MNGLRKLFTVRDLSTGAPWKRIASFAGPMLIGNIAQQLYNTADSIIVGRYVGDNALAAVGSAAPLLFLLLALFVGVSTGTGVLVAQSFGAKDGERLAQVVGNALTLTAIATGVIMVVGTLITRPLLVLMGTPSTILDWATDYLHIFFLGIAGFFFYNVLSGILRGMGDVFSALMFLLVAAGLNVALDLFFVAKLGMGVPGVALATIIAQGISAVLCLLKLLRMRDVFHLRLSDLRLRKMHVMGIVRLGVPAGITQAIFSLAMLVVQSLTNSFGELFIACNVIVMRVDGFAMMPNFTFGETMATYTGQNVGARRLDRVRLGAKQGLSMALGVSAILTLLILIFGTSLMSIFTQTQELIEMGMRMLRLLAVGYVAMAVTQCLSGVLRGMGDTLTPMWISLFTTVVLRVPIAYGLAYFTRSEAYPQGRPESVFISLLASWTIGALITSVVYVIKMRQRKELRPLEATLSE